jgi:hypothetical protein
LVSVATLATVAAALDVGTADEAPSNGSHREFCPLELEAVKWACCFSNIDVASLLCIAQSLPATVVAEQVEKYQNRPQEPEPLAETKPCARPTTTRRYTTSLFKARVKIGEEFREFCQTHKIEAQAKPFKPPHGFVDLFIKQCSLIKGLATDRKSKKILDPW